MRLRDDSLSLVTQGYAFLPNRRRAEGRDTLRLSLLGRTVVAGLGPDWTRRFCDEQFVERSSALPGLVRNTLVGDGAVHTLDGVQHRARKAFFSRTLDGKGICALAQGVLRAMERAEPRWADAGEIVLFDEAAVVLLEAVWEWSGLPEVDVGSTAADMVAMVDAFGSVGPRNLRGRRARSRQEGLLSRFVDEARTGHRTAPSGSLFEAACRLRDIDGELVAPRLAAVEMLNVIRPTVATTWFLAYSVHALERHPELRMDLASGDPVLVRSFAQEVRRFYPFAPFLGGTSVREAAWDDVTARPRDLVLLDIYGQNHHPDLWPKPYTFDPCRFEGLDLDPWTLVPQGGGSAEDGHRCPGEPGVVLLLEVLLPRLAAMGYEVPAQDDSISLGRVPARPASGMVLLLGRSA